LVGKAFSAHFVSQTATKRKSFITLTTGRQPLNFYICSNAITYDMVDNNSFKMNWQLTILQVISFCHVKRKGERKSVARKYDKVKEFIKK
jgi:hypothetical protein